MKTANYHLIKRLEMIIVLLRECPNISKRHLLERLNGKLDTKLGIRSLERAFQTLDADFGIEVVYNRAKNGYSITPEDEERIVGFLRFAGRIYLADLLQEGMKEFEELKSAIRLEDYSDFEGLRWIQPLFPAIKNRLNVRFEHENYQKRTRKSYRITPLQLREYKGRWYVVGLPAGGDHIKTFGLDRIAKLKVEGGAGVFPETCKGELEKFDQIIGLNYSDGDGPVFIRLMVSGQQAKYLKSLPLHASQVFEGELPGGWHCVRLFLIPNYELKMDLLKMGNQIKVLEPKSLQAEIKELLIKALKLYDDE